MVRVVPSETLPNVAVIVTVPAPVIVAWPFEPTVLEITARPLDALHVTAFVRSCVVLSEKVPVAVNCTPPDVTLTVGLDGDMLIDVRTDEVTVTEAELEVIPEKLAVTVAGPTARALARPLVSAALLMVRTREADDVHVAEAVTSCDVPSEKVPVATNCCVPPRGMLVFPGVTAMDTRVAGRTVKAAAFDSLVAPKETKDAEMAVVPGVTDTARPGDADGLPMAAIVGDEDVHEADDVRS